MDGESFRILFIRRGVERGLAWVDNEQVVNSVVKAVVSQWLLPFVPDNEAPIPLTNFLSRAAKARGPIRSFPGTNHAIAGPVTYIHTVRPSVFVCRLRRTAGVNVPSAETGSPDTGNRSN